MIDISYEKDPIYYQDYEECLRFLRTIKDEDYEYPEEKVNFHIYTEVKNKKELMIIKSFLATQNLEKCNLIVWSDYNIEDNPLIQPYKKYLDMRIWNPVLEAEGTILEGRYDVLLAKDHKHYLQSDLLRIIALHKYGGVWADMDIILLRDFVPLFGQEYMYMWGSETDFARMGACATVLSLNKGSQFSLELMKQISITPPIPATCCWGKDMFAPLYRRYKYPVLPSTFFNTEWCINKKYPGYSNKIQKSWFEDAPKPENDTREGANDNYLFKEAFAWHWHNDTNKKIEEIDANSKFGLLNSFINKLLKSKGINNVKK